MTNRYVPKRCRKCKGTKFSYRPDPVRDTERIATCKQCGREQVLDIRPKWLKAEHRD